MNKLLLFLTTISIMALGCDSSDNTDSTIGDGSLDGCYDVEVSDIVSSYQLNAWAVFSQLSNSTDGNVVYSPLSLQQVLAMILAGSAEDTYSEISALLNLNDVDLDCIGLTNYELIDDLTKDGQLSSISTAFYDERFTFDQDYEAFLETYFEISPQQERFADDTTVDVINTWASNATNGRIDNLLDKVESNEVLLLLHALQLKADWLKGFSEQNTQPQAFTTATGSIDSVMTMFGDDLWHCAHTEDWRIASLPTADSIYALTCLAPTTQSVQAWLSSSTSAQLSSTYSSLKTSLFLQRAQLHLPKFAISEKYIFNEDLKQLGMNEAFNPLMARLEGMGSAGGNLYISRVIQDIYLSIDEKGIEGAAVTLGGIAEESAPPAIRFNEPFIIVVEHIATGTPIFLGIINNPAANN